MENKCSFCGEKNEYLVPINNVAICENCIDLAKIQFSHIKKHSKNDNKFKLLHPLDMVNDLDKFIVGQDVTKRKLSIAITNHYKRILSKKTKIKLKHENVNIEKSNILLLGPTGTGKTAMVKAIAEMVNVPIAIGDATTLTEAGYVGEDVENLILNLIHSAEFNIQRAEIGIIYIDEIDKIRKTSSNMSITRDVSGEGVQQSLLKLIEGTLASVPPTGGRKHPQQEFIKVDTSDILFICGGSFAGIEDIISSRLNKNKLGFNVNSLEEDENILSYVNNEDLIKFGFIPEFVGRLPIITYTNDLSIEDLEKILLNTKNSIIKQYQNLFYFDGIELNFTNQAVKVMAQHAKILGLGARSLRSIIEKVLYPFFLKKDLGDNLIIDENQVLEILNTGS